MQHVILKTTSKEILTLSEIFLIVADHDQKKDMSEVGTELGARNQNE